MPLIERNRLLQRFSQRLAEATQVDIAIAWATPCDALEHVRKNTRLSPHAHVQFLVPERGSLGTRLHLAWDYK